MSGAAAGRRARCGVCPDPHEEGVAQRHLAGQPVRMFSPSAAMAKMPPWSPAAGANRPGRGTPEPGMNLEAGSRPARTGKGRASPSWSWCGAALVGLVGGVEEGPASHTRPDLRCAEQPVGADEQDHHHQEVGDDPGEPGPQESRSHRYSLPPRRCPPEKPPTTAPTIESSPPMITAGKARKAMKAVAWSTPVARRGRRRRRSRPPPPARPRWPMRPRRPSDVDPLGHGRLLVEGGGAHRHPGPRPEEKSDADQEHDGHHDLDDSTRRSAPFPGRPRCAPMGRRWAGAGSR